MDEWQLFDQEQPYSVVNRKLPHWTQAATVAFITWRTQDSIPRSVAQQLIYKRDLLLKSLNIDPTGDWRAELALLPRRLRNRVQWTLTERWDRCLDACYGSCVLRDPLISGIVGNSLEYADGEKYRVFDYVVMPNHLHLLAAFPSGDDMLKQAESWKRFTAVRINRELGVRGRFWQDDEFDHLVRSIEQFEFLRRYIADNPRRAHLRSDEFRWHSSHNAR